MGKRSFFTRLRSAKKAFSDPQSINRNAAEKGEKAGQFLTKAGKGLIYVVFGGIFILIFYFVFFAGGFFKSLFKIKDED
jgi:hypothetical protein